MSNIFITVIVGSGTYAIPTNDTELAAATSGLDTLLGGVANLDYDRVLAWVEDFGGPDGAEGVRSLNCLVEKFTYLTKECPSEAEVDTMTAAIESALEADANITSIGNQQVHLFQAGAYFLWNRDIAGGFLYPTTTSDDVVVGGSGSPNGKWFDDGDLVLGAAAMSGTEKLRVVGDVRVEGEMIVTGLVSESTGFEFTEQYIAPGGTPATVRGTCWVRNDIPNEPYFTDNSGTDYPLLLSGASGPSSFKSFHFTQRSIASGDYWAAGYYDAPAADVTLDQASTTQIYGTANTAYGAHAFIVAGGAGSVNTGQVGLRVTGTSITDAAVRTTSDTETLTDDITSLSTDDYLETTKKWIGTVTFELYTVSGTPTVYSVDFNYGFAKYENFGSVKFTVTDFEVVGLAGATDSSFDIVFYKHEDQGWTYSAAAFSPGGTVISKMSTDYVTEDNLTISDYFAYKRAGLSTFIPGNSGQGVVVKIQTSQSFSVQSSVAHIGMYETIRGPNLLPDGDCESPGVADWTAQDATLSKDTSDPAEGTRSLKITSIASGGVVSPAAYQFISIIAGRTYRITGCAKSDGILIPRVILGGVSVWVGSTSTSWQYFDETTVATSTLCNFWTQISGPSGTEFMLFDCLYVSEE
jgi:hypothetical protein